MSGESVLREAFVAAVARHEQHRPRLYQGRDGIYRCPECQPRASVVWFATDAVARWWERVLLAAQTRRWR
jgi:hypothetical protein